MRQAYGEWQWQVYVVYGTKYRKCYDFFYSCRVFDARWGLCDLFVSHVSREKKWDTALVAVWENVPHVLSFATMLTIFKEGVDVMLTRWQEYRDRRKNIIEKAREEGYKKGYEAAKAENRESGSGKGTPHSASEKKKK